MPPMRKRFCEAVGRPTMRFVPVKTAEQQATALLHRGREQLVRQRTMLVNALRAHLAEFGIVAAQGLRNVGELIAIVRDDGDTRLPDAVRQVLQVLANQIEQIETAVAALERQLLAWHKTNPISQRLASIPGIGPIIATPPRILVVDDNLTNLEVLRVRLKPLCVTGQFCCDAQRGIPTTMW